MSGGIRNQYSKLGVKEYYHQKGEQYSNPHFEQVEQLLKQNESRIDYSKVLDLSCGSGEVSRVLSQLGYEDFHASDPYTQKAFQERLKRECFSWSFEDIVKGVIKEKYSAIICSFAMHLCPKDILFALCYQLFQHSSQLVIITPHKRPELENFEGITLNFEDFCLTDRGKKVRLKSYVSTF